MNEQDWGLNEGVMGVGGGGSNAPFTDEGWLDASQEQDWGLDPDA